MGFSSRYKNIALKVVVVLFCLHTTVNHVQAEQDRCRGAFDVYFVLDRSSSLLKQFTNHFRSDAVPFVENLSKMFVSPLLRMSYITFAGSANVVMPLTGDRKIIESKLDDLKHIIPDGPTIMNRGIAEANQQIRSISARDRRASVIIVLTDGKLEHVTKIQTVAEADVSRDMGATVFVVGVSNFDRNQLRDIAGGRSDFVFEATNFGKLSVIANRILDSSCVEILSASPAIVCVNETFNVHIYGNGFNRNGDISRTMCNFWTDEYEILIKPKEASDTYLECESPKNFFFQDEKIITVQVTLNEGLSFISSNVTISALKCAHATSYLIIGMIFLGFLALLAVWWLWNIITCKKRPVKAEPKPSRPPPPPPKETSQPKQWPSVDASYYGGSGAGGIKPVPVKWGDKGSTEAAAHLERTKDAKEISVNLNTSSDINANEVSPESDTLCTKLCGIVPPVGQCYAWMASKRPMMN